MRVKPGVGYLNIWRAGGGLGQAVFLDGVYEPPVRYKVKFGALQGISALVYVVCLILRNDMP